MKPAFCSVLFASLFASLALRAEAIPRAGGTPRAWAMAPGQLKTRFEKPEEEKQKELLPFDLYTDQKKDDVWASEPEEVHELLGEMEKLFMYNYIQKKAPSNRLSIRPDGLSEINFLLVQEHKIPSVVTWDSAGKPTLRMMKEAKAAPPFGNMQEFTKGILRLTQDHMVKFQQLGSYEPEAPNMRFGRSAFKDTVEKIKQKGAQYELNVKDYISCGHYINHVTGEHETVIGRGTYARARVAAPKELGFHEILSKTVITPMPWGAVMMEGTVPLPHYPSNAIDRNTAKVLNERVNLPPAQKLGRNRKIWKREKRIAQTEEAKNDPYWQSFDKETDALDFTCTQEQLFSHSYEENRKTLGHCVQLPLKSDELFPDELARIQCGSDYPKKTEVIYQKKLTVKMKPNDISGTEVHYWYTRKCTPKGWTEPTHVTDALGFRKHKECLAFQLSGSQFGAGAKSKISRGTQTTDVEQAAKFRTLGIQTGMPYEGQEFPKKTTRSIGVQ